MNINALEVFNPGSYGHKQRIGSDNDGGYVVIKEHDPKYDLFISCGISDDISFETAFLKENSSIEKCIAFDGTIEKLPYISEEETEEDKSIKNRIEFVKKNISHIENNESEESKTTNLHYLINDKKDIFLKMDIEGAEYGFFAVLNKKQMQSFKQIVVEFHHPSMNKDNWNILSKIKETHWLVHIHPNNNCGTLKFHTSDNDKIIEIPNVFECTYVRKQFLELSSESVPSSIDMPNVLDKEEIVLNGYPYVNNI